MDRFYLLDEGLGRKAGAESTQGRLSLVEARSAAHDGAHDVGDEFVYVIDGELEVGFDGRTHRLTPGMCVLLPRGVAHAVGEGGHTLRLTAPGEPEDGGSGGWGDKDRFYVLDQGQARPGRIPVPPAFSVKARTEDTDGLFSLLEVTVAQPVPRHVHHVADECIYVLDGVLDVEFDGQVHQVGKGQFVLLPHGVPHAIRPGSNPPPRVIQISSPGGWECVVEALIEHRTEVSKGRRFDPAALNRYTRRYHVAYEEV
ncbi:cupin domain-containing protein [Nonomuraea sediminis]|uniref:cupin domain-containing protein n=1 Tax=Nonomuraea sediminis TaxID=2835864 RepID=UPI00202A53B8|nr:cupin domain-containing protein [Nonomuraea sediminis]